MPAPEPIPRPAPATGTRFHTGIRAVARREYMRIRGRAVYGLLVLVLPPLSFALTWGMFSSASPRDLPVAVVDLDHSALSRRLTRLVDAASSMVVAFQPGDPAAAEDLLLRGRVYAALVVPRHLEADIKRNRGGAVVAYTNSQMLLPGSIIASSLNSLVATASGNLHRQARLRGGEMGAAATAHLEPIRIDRHVLFNPQLNYLYFLAAALCPTFLQLFVLMTTVMAVGEEFKEGTARRWLATAGGSPWRAVTGKLAVYWLPFAGTSTLMLAMTAKGFGIPVRGSLPLLVVATLLLVLAMQACALVLLVITPSLRMALSMASFYAGTAFAFVGLTFPQAGMPALGRAWSRLLPLTHYLHLFQQQTLRGAPRSQAAAALLCLGLFMALGILVIPRLKRHMVDSRAWGRP